MCELLDKVENEAYRKTARKLFENGVPLDVVEASISDLPKDEIQDIFNEFVQKKN